MLTRLYILFSNISARAYALVAEVMLVLLGAALMAVDLSYLPSQVYHTRFGDFYTYLAFAGIISLWSFFGIIVTLMRWKTGVKVYAFFLAIFGALQIALGFIHVVLLFTLYRYTLVTACSDSASDKLFWWSLGHVQADEEAQQLIDNCYAQWSRIAAQRTITWVVYSMLLISMMTLVYRYQGYLKRLREPSDTDEEEWSDEKPIVHIKRQPHSGSCSGSRRTKKKRAPPSSQEEQLPPPPAYSDVMPRASETYYEQRQKLYTEIEKRRKAAARKSGAAAAAPREGGAGAVHPLDLTQGGGEDYTPPSPPPPPPVGETLTVFESSSSPAISDAQTNPFSSEKMDYDEYRATQHHPVPPPPDTLRADDDDRTMASSRRSSKRYDTKPEESVTHKKEEEEESEPMIVEESNDNQEEGEENQEDGEEEPTERDRLT